MGCDVHAVLQKKKEDQWVTIDTDILPNRDYELFSLLSGVRGQHRLGPVLHAGFPEDFEVSAWHSKTDEVTLPNCHEGYYMGEHSFGWATLQELVDVPLADSWLANKAQFNITQHEDGYTVNFLTDEDLPDTSFRTLQKAFRLLYWNLKNYRIVVGYDS